MAQAEGPEAGGPGVMSHQGEAHCLHQGVAKHVCSLQKLTVRESICHPEGPAAALSRPTEHHSVLVSKPLPRPQPGGVTNGIL